MMPLHIKRPLNPRYISRVRPYGGQRYIVLGKPCKTLQQAAARMIRKFTSDSEFKRGDVLMVENYYDPFQVMEVTR